MSGPGSGTWQTPHCRATAVLALMANLAAVFDRKDNSSISERQGVDNLDNPSQSGSASLCSLAVVSSPGRFDVLELPYSSYSVDPRVLGCRYAAVGAVDREASLL